MQKWSIRILVASASFITGEQDARWWESLLHCKDSVSLSSLCSVLFIQNIAE